MAQAPETLLVLRGGEVLAGDASVVEALSANCDALDVCGAQKRVCARREIGKGLDALALDADASYPLFFCGVPEDEPSCLPSRGTLETADASSIYDGLPTATDGDGDGVLDEADAAPWDPTSR